MLWLSSPCNRQECKLDEKGKQIKVDYTFTSRAVDGKERIDTYITNAYNYYKDLRKKRSKDNCRYVTLQAMRPIVAGDCMCKCH